MGDKDTVWDKIKTNVRHYTEEFAAWKLNMVHVRKEWRESKGVYNKVFHKGIMNFTKESFEVLPYTLSHALIYGLVIFGLIKVYSWVT